MRQVKIHFKILIKKMINKNMVHIHAKDKAFTTSNAMFPLSRFAAWLKSRS